MSDDEETQPAIPQESELESLQGRATLMGIKFHPNMGVKKLKALVNARLEGTSPEVDDEEEEVIEAPVFKADKAETKEQKDRRENAARKAEAAARIKHAKALTRIRLTSMNPAKQDWNGEIYTIQSRGMGTIRKYVPFNATAGWHVPNALLDFLQHKECQVFYNGKDHSGRTVRKSKMAKEFAIEILPPLTKVEIERIATRQAAQNTLTDDE